MIRPELVHRMSRLVLVTSSIVAVVAGCGGNQSGAARSTSGPGATGDKTFTDSRFAFSFAYPAALTKTEVTAGERTGGKAKATVGFALDTDNLVFVDRDAEVDTAVTAANIGDVVPEVDSFISEAFKIPVNGSAVVVGGFPAVRYEDLDNHDPPQTRSRVVILFDHKVEYEINCQSNLKGRQQVTGACDRILTTLHRH